MILEEVYEKMKVVLGENHEMTLITKSQIAKHHSDLRDINKALMILEEAYEKQRSMQGEKHKGTLFTQFQIANHHSHLGGKQAHDFRGSI